MKTATQPLNGVRKCAVLCLALGPKEAVRILGSLSPPEVEAVSREIASIPEVGAEVVQKVLEEYRSAPAGAERTVRGGLDTAREFLAEALGPIEAETIVERIRVPAGAGPLAHLERMEPRLFAGILGDEHPQTIAVILAHLDLKVAARTIEELPPELASDVLFRMAGMDKIMPEMLALLEEGLRSKTDVSLSQELSTPGDPAKVAKLLNMAQGERGQRILHEIEARSKELATRIKSLMFVFEDLLLVDGKGMQRILRDVEGKELALALKGASEELRTHVKANMSSRAAAALDEDMDLLGAVRVREVETSQGRIMESVRQLEQDGEIVVQREGSGDDLVR